MYTEYYIWYYIHDRSWSYIKPKLPPGNSPQGSFPKPSPCHHFRTDNQLPRGHGNETGAAQRQPGQQHPGEHQQPGWKIDRKRKRTGLEKGLYNWYNPICSMYAIFTNICPKNNPKVGKYTIHGAYGNYSNMMYYVPYLILKYGITLWNVPMIIPGPEAVIIMICQEIFSHRGFLSHGGTQKKHPSHEKSAFLRFENFETIWNLDDWGSPMTYEPPRFVSYWNLGDRPLHRFDS